MEEAIEAELIPTVVKNGNRIVVQHNALAEARYKLSLRAQKLLIRLIAELDQRSDDFTEIKLSLRDFAALAAQERNDVTFTHFVDAAEQFIGRFVAITQPPVEGEEQARQLVCHWISSIEKNPNDKSITFSFDKKLKPYLLGLKRSFFSYRPLYAFNLGSTYSIRLYQWAKSREYLRRPQQVSVDELRLALGTIEFDGRGRIQKESLKRYADFNRVALKPAKEEINKKTDISLSFREVKQPGTKIVSALVFSVRRNEVQALRGFEIPRDPQFELSFRDKEAADTLPDTELLLNHLKNIYQLSDEQVAKVNGYISKNGMEYVREKLTLTELEPRENVARFFMAALRDDFKLPVRRVPEPKRPRKVPQPVLPVPPEQTDEERLAGAQRLRELRRSLAFTGKS
jgi:plasmid replication initiation protein